jgi:hypothetical protein
VSASRVASRSNACFVLLASGDVHRDALHPDDATLCVPDGLTTRQQPAEMLAIAFHLEFELVRRPSVACRLDRRPEAFPALLAEQLAPCSAGSGRQRRVEPVHAVELERPGHLAGLRVEVPAADVRDPLGRIELLRAQRQLLLSPSALGDVVVRPDHAQWRSVGGPQRDPAATSDPAPVAVRMPHAELLVVQLVRTVHVAVDRSLHDLEIARVAARCERVEARWPELVTGQAEHLDVRVIDDELTGAHVPVPQCQAARLEHEGEAFEFADRRPGDILIEVDVLLGVGVRLGEHRSSVVMRGAQL